MGKEDLINRFVERCVHDMDTDSLVQVVSDYITENLDKLSKEDLIKGIKESKYSEILEEEEFDGMDI